MLVYVEQNRRAREEGFDSLVTAVSNRKWVSVAEAPSARDRRARRDRSRVSMYTKKEWGQSRITPFYHNVEQDAIAL